MTATPRQLSDAIKADVGDIIEERAEENRILARWTVIRTVAGWMAFSVVVTLLTTLLLWLLTGSILGFLVFVAAFTFSPLLCIPALIVWAVAASIVFRLEARRSEMLFSRYGVTIERTVEPPVYSVGSLPVSWLKPELRRTKSLLTSEGDTEHAGEDER